MEAAAVREQGGPRGEAVGQQEQHRLGDLGLGSGAAGQGGGGLAGEGGVPDLRGTPGPEIAVDRARRDHIDPDGGEIDRQPAPESLDGAVGGGVERRALRRSGAGGAGHQHHRAVGRQLGRGGAHAAHLAPELAVERRGQRRLVGMIERRDRVGGGRREQVVDAVDQREEPGDRGRIEHVDRSRPGVGTQAFARGLEPVERAAADHHPSAALDEGLRRGQPDPRAAADHHQGLVIVSHGPRLRRRRAATETT
ncbi:hypothetical protein V6S85_16490 [Caulobacter sp. CCNWLW153]|uniref:hypothetical protein n=1 Tax=Caulobacter sp. CCNWYY153 TaxID=3125797 RepID=UPI003099DE92